MSRTKLVQDLNLANTMLYGGYLINVTINRKKLFSVKVVGFKPFATPHIP